LVSSPLGILSLASQSLTRNSILGVSSLWFYRVGESGQRGQSVCILCVCVFAFDLCVIFIVFVVFFMFILFPHHKSRESVRIGPHPGGPPLISAVGGAHQPRYGKFSGLVPRIHGIIGVQQAQSQKSTWVLSPATWVHSPNSEVHFIFASSTWLKNWKFTSNLL
jgi:hypothetical protein